MIANKLPRILRSARLRLALFFVAVTTLTLVGFGWYTHQQLLSELEARHERLQADVLQRLSVTLPGALWNFDLAAMGQVVASEIGPPEVRGIWVQDSLGTNLVGSTKAADGRVVQTTELRGVSGVPTRRPIFRNGVSSEQSARPEGYVIVVFSRDPIDQALAANLRTLLVQIVLVDLVLLLLLIWGLRMVFAPLARLRNALMALAHQESDEMTALAPARLTKLDALTEGFNQTVSKLKLVIEHRTEAQAQAQAATQETRKVLEQLVAAQDELVKAGKLAALGRLVAGIAHELNTPIGNGLMAASSLLDQIARFKAEMAGPNPRRSSLQQFLTNAESGVDLTLRSLNRSATLVSRFKEIAPDNRVAHVSQFDVHELVDQVLRGPLGAALADAGCQVEHCPGLAVLVQSDLDMLAQVLNCLITNAMVHAFEGREPGRITVKVEQDPEHFVLISVRDNGVGIAAENLTKVFDPFFSTRLGRGESGLGLYIANNIVTEALHGKLQVISQLGMGTEFSIYMPQVLSVDLS